MGLAERLQRSVCDSRARTSSKDGAFTGFVSDANKRDHNVRGGSIERSNSSPDFCYAAGGKRNASRSVQRPGDRRPVVHSSSTNSLGGRQGFAGGRPASAGPSRPASASAGQSQSRHISSGSRPATAPAPAPAPAPAASASHAEKPALAITSYLRLFGLSQYSHTFEENGLGDLGALARLSENQALDFLESIQVYPGHRVKLLRACEGLRSATVLGSTRNVSKEDALMERLCERNEMLSQERGEVQAQNQILHEENHHLSAQARELAAQNRQQAEELEAFRARTEDLDQVVWAQTEQVSFLALQLQRVMERQHAKPRSGSAAAPAASAKVPDGDFLRASAASRHAMAAMTVTGSEKHADHMGASPTGPPQSHAPPTGPLDSEHIAECLEGGANCDRSVQCLAAAIHSRLQAGAAGFTPSRPNNARHNAGGDAAGGDATASVIFSEAKLSPEKSWQSRPAVAMDPDSPTLQHSPSGSERSLSACSPLTAGIAPSVPSKWNVCEFISEIMQMFQMQPETGIVALVYLDRYLERSSASLTMDTWRRLAFTSLVMASKVWDDVAFDNQEIAQISPHYSLEEVCGFEKAFLQTIEFDLSMHESEFTAAQQALHTLGGKSGGRQAEASMLSLGAKRAAVLMERCEKEQASLRQRYAAA